jgi:hypothetical protein
VDGGWWWRPVIDGQSSGSGLSRADHPTNREASKVAVQWTRSHHTSWLAAVSLSSFVSPTPDLPRSVPSLGRWNLWAVHFLTFLTFVLRRLGLSRDGRSAVRSDTGLGKSGSSVLPQKLLCVLICLLFWFFSFAIKIKIFNLYTSPLPPKMEAEGIDVFV